MAGWMTRDGADLILEVWVQPGAPHTEIVGTHGDRLKIRVGAPAVDGRANGALCDYIAAVCDVPRRRITLETGERGRGKRIRISAVPVIPEILTRHLHVDGR
jgi:uncharacterized protein